MINGEFIHQQFLFFYYFIENLSFLISMMNQNLIKYYLFYFLKNYFYHIETLMIFLIFWEKKITILFHQQASS